MCKLFFFFFLFLLFFAVLFQWNSVVSIFPWDRQNTENEKKGNKYRMADKNPPNIGPDITYIELNPLFPYSSFFWGGGVGATQSSVQKCH